ncbi:hypothetical protein HXY33_04645 [Candidatus Bathyarchaeota archaeon]|nr:hypothetical protein [Candidatus Bathyarchaeota archaeon]
MIRLERKVKLLTFSTMLILAILSGIAVMVYANGVTNSTNTTSDLVYYNGDYYNGITAPFGRHGRGCGWGFGGSITVSQEYKDNVISIAQNDSDVQNLLADGYNITDVRPIISTVVEADGTVIMKATTAIVMLSQDTTGRAYVTVDVEQAKVTEIVILTRTVIEK